MKHRFSNCFVIAVSLCLLLSGMNSTIRFLRIWKK